MEKAILIVIDERAMEKWLPVHFARKGWSAICTADEAAAIGRVTEKAFDVIIIDAVLGERHAFALIQEIRRLRPETFMICISALAGSAARLKALAAGADAYLAKPFALAELDRLIGADRGQGREASA